MPALEVYHREGCTLPHWRRGERLRWFFSTVRCSGKPQPRATTSASALALEAATAPDPNPRDPELYADDGCEI